MNLAIISEYYYSNSGCSYVVLALVLLAGDIPCENSLLRQVSSLLRRLPAIESEKFQDDFLMVSDC